MLDEDFYLFIFFDKLLDEKNASPLTRRFPDLTTAFLLDQGESPCYQCNLTE